MKYLLVNVDTDELFGEREMTEEVAKILNDNCRRNDDDCRWFKYPEMVDCPACDGEGFISCIPGKCPQCDGEKVVDKDSINDDPDLGGEDYGGSSNAARETQLKHYNEKL